MNRDARYLLAGKHERRAKLFERKYIKPIAEVIHKDIVRFVGYVRTEGIEGAKRHLDRKFYSSEIGEVLNELYSEVGLYKMALTLRQIEKSAKEEKGFGYNPQWVAAILNYLRTHLLNTVKGIVQTTKKNILDLLSVAETEGWGVEKTAQKINEIAPDISVARARTIARTEVGAGMWAGQEQAAQESKWETIDTWVSAKDSRVRHSHREMDGRSVPTGAKFLVPRYQRIGGIRGKRKGVLVQTGFDVMSGPGDPKASPENKINCRCTKVTTAKRDERGRLIRKKQLMIS